MSRDLLDDIDSITQDGRAGLMALLDQPRDALIALDFDGTLSPIVADARQARAHPGAVPVLAKLARSVGTLAVITGRPAAEAVALGGLAAVPGIIVIGHYGAQRWRDGQLSTPEAPPAVDQARQAMPRLLREAGAPEGTWIEVKQYAVAVHTRPTADPEAALALLRDPLTALAAELGLAAEPGRLVIELRPGGVDKGSALTGLVRDTSASSDVYCGDDLGDLPAFAAVRTLRGEGVPGCTVASASQEAPEVAAEADLVVPGPGGVVQLLNTIAAAL
jgi:trehalose 6-phosphate phosphatase